MVGYSWSTYLFWTTYTIKGKTLNSINFLKFQLFSIIETNCMYFLFYFTLVLPTSKYFISKNPKGSTKLFEGHGSGTA